MHYIIRATTENLDEKTCEMAPRLNGGKCLDIGSGNGVLAHKLAEKIKPASFTTCDLRKNHLNNFIHADLNKKLPFSSGEFDVVTCNQVIEHLYFTDDFINEVHRILKPDGILLINTENLAGFYTRLMLLFGKQPVNLHPSEWQWGNSSSGKYDQKFGHKSMFTYKGFKEFLRFHGFRIERSYTHTIYFIPKPLSRIVCSILPNWGQVIMVSVRKSPSGNSAKKLSQSHQKV
jgi:ubiquinone/menaquinone biosynthesis C-methylase UbiE